MSKITVFDLEVFYRVGVPDEERAHAQRLLVTVKMEQDFATAISTDNLNNTIDYNQVVQRLLKFGEGRSWKLAERLASDIADMILADFRPQTVSVEVKKFIVPETKHVAVSLTRGLVPGRRPSDTSL